MSLKTTVVCLCFAVVICMKLVASKSLFESEIRPGMEDTELQDVMVKRQLDSRDMAILQYCLTRGRFDSRCRRRPNIPINVVTQ